MADDGWFPDPFGRYEQRWFDGERWTERVIADGQTGIDPLGSTASVPFATPSPSPELLAPTEHLAPDPTAVLPAPQAAPPTAPGPEAGDEPRHEQDPPTPRSDPTAPLTRLNANAVTGDRKTPRGHAVTGDRKTPNAVAALGAAGGLVAALGVLFFLGDDPEPVAVAVFGAALLVAAWFLVRSAPGRSADLGAAAVAIASVGIVAFAFGSLDHQPGAERWFVIAALFGLAYVVTGFRGHTFMLGAALVAAVVAVSVALGGGSFGDDSTVEGEAIEAASFDLGVSGEATAQGRVALLCGAACLAAMVILDQRGRRATATAFAATAVAAGIGASIVLALTSEHVSTPVAVALFGIAAVAAGHATRRRATTWSGAGLTTAGLVGIPLTIFEPDSPASQAPWLIVGGALAALGPRLWRELRRRRVSGGSAART